MATAKKSRKTNFEEMYKGFRELSTASSIEFEKLVEFFEKSLVSGFNKEYRISEVDQRPTIKVVFDEKKSRLEIVRKYQVVQTDDDVEDFDNQMTLKDALEIDKKAEVGSEISEVLDVDSWSTATLNHVKQLFCSDFAKEKNNILRDHLESKNNEIVRAKVLRSDGRGNLYCELVGLKTEALLGIREQLRNDKLDIGDEFTAYVYKIENLSKTAKLKADIRVYISRTRKELVERVLAREIPEIRDNLVTIVNVARQPGVATKIAVKSEDYNIDPVAACVGEKAIRINTVKHEVGGELVEIINYKENSIDYILEALKPATLKTYKYEELSKQFEGYVDTKQAFRIAIGKSNAALVSRLTGWTIKIVNPEEVVQEQNNEEREEE